MLFFETLGSLFRDRNNGSNPNAIGFYGRKTPGQNPSKQTIAKRWTALGLGRNGKEYTNLGVNYNGTKVAYGGGGTATAMVTDDDTATGGGAGNGQGIGGHAASIGKTANPGEAKKRVLKKKLVRKESFREAVSVVSADPINIGNQNQEGHKLNVILITEGLGNPKDKNYYGPEALQSAPAVFEGSPCYIDHPSVSEETDIPERRVKNKCGYYKNLTVTEINGKMAVSGELHLDLSESGELAYKKALTAIHYQNEFPGSEKQYVGLSVNADGTAEKRTIDIGGVPTEVNYVTSFTVGESCDIVTKPARGGQIVSLIESADGRKKKEAGKMKKMLKAIESALTHLSAGKMSTAERILRESKKEGESEAANPGDQVEGLLAQGKGESNSDHLQRVGAIHKAVGDHIKAMQNVAGASPDQDGDGDGAGQHADGCPAASGEGECECEGESEAEGEAEESEGEGEAEEVNGDAGNFSQEPAGINKKKVSVKSNIPTGASKTAGSESRRLAIKWLIKESKIPSYVFNQSDIVRLAKMPFSEAKYAIRREARLFEAQKRSLGNVPTGSNFSRESGNSRESGTSLLKSLLRS